ncbi:MAG TPA: radical SAM family heme chaperone HemW [Terracidiphilus sp.]|jgi:oxygen-independent coproporphyrinogen-3 oxidase
MHCDADNALGIYISIPFCRSKCTYCNFASGVYPAADHERYVERLIEDLCGARARASRLGAKLPRRVDTIYLGGGTPSLLAPELLLHLFRSIRAQFDLVADAEITMECAPGQIPAATLEAMTTVGVDRVSLGVQSFVDEEAHASGRLHNRSTVEEDLRSLRAAGIQNLNVDLIAGLAGQTFASWEESLAVLADSDVPHASVYMLEVDEDSRLGRELLQKGTRYRAGLVPADDAIARMYERAIERLDGAGLNQYEISNFARPGFESKHNLRYWKRRPYLGVGLDASSMMRSAPSDPTAPWSAGVEEVNRDFVLRATTTDDLKAYLAGPTPHETSWLSPAQQFEEAWFLGLRMNDGVVVDRITHEFGPEMIARAMTTVERLIDDGLLVFDGERVQLTPRGRLLSNDVFAEFLDSTPEPEAVLAG